VNLLPDIGICLILTKDGKLSGHAITRIESQDIGQTRHELQFAWLMPSPSVIFSIVSAVNIEVHHECGTGSR
jgi:hypothetical protein